MNHNPILTREAMLAALRTWESCAAEYLVRSSLTRAVGWYLDALSAPGILPAEAPLREHCAAARGWSRGIYANKVYRTITKSNLLARMLYSGEAPRTRKCPIHQGHWSGCTLEGCPEGCGECGWLPEEVTP